MYQDRVLCPAMSFSFYQFVDGDVISIIPKEQEVGSLPSLFTSGSRTNYSTKLRERFNLKFAQKFSDPESVFEQIQNATDPNTSNESARLSDLTRIHIEANPHTYRKVCNRFASIGSYDSLRTSQFPTVIPNKPTSPSTGNLPGYISSSTMGPNFFPY